MIKQWSYSRLQAFEKCPLRAKYAYLDKIPEPERPLPKGKAEHANDRGSRIHTLAEGYSLGKISEVPHELRFFAPELERLRTLVARCKASLEGEWAFNEEWVPVSWFAENVWGRVKLDAFVQWTREEVIVVDYKTGKRYGNEFMHTEQCQLYALSAVLRYPNVETVYVELWYPDLDELYSTQYTRKQILARLRGWETRARRMTQATEFKPNANLFSCQWCPYNPRLGGHCEYAVNVGQQPKVIVA